jgi:benzoylformate decarboxylase
MLPEVFLVGQIFAPGAQVIHIDLNAYEIAKNHPVDLGLVSDPKLTLARLATALAALMTPKQKAAARARRAAIADAKTARQASEMARDDTEREALPLHFSRFMAELATQLPEDTIIFDEALTNSPAITRYRPPTKSDHYFLTRGGSLGVGIPAPLGSSWPTLTGRRGLRVTGAMLPYRPCGRQPATTSMPNLWSVTALTDCCNSTSRPTGTSDIFQPMTFPEL